MFSWIDGLHQAFHFCSLKCKADFLEIKYPVMQEKEREREEAEESVLPEVRSFIARKTERGITVVRGYSGVRRGSDTDEAECPGSDSSGEKESKKQL